MHGTTTAPVFITPRTTSSQSTVLPATTMTRSPGLTPRSRSVVAQTAAPSAISRNDPVLDDAVLPEERQRAALRIARERLDDVAREVEAIGNLPAAVDERRSEGELERRAGQRRCRAPRRRADAKTFHGFSIIDPNRLKLNANRVIVRIAGSVLREAELDGERLVGRKPLRKPESARFLERGDACARSAGAC